MSLKSEVPLYLSPTSIKFNRFLKLILIEHKPLLACFGFMTSQKWLVSGNINLRKRLNLIEVGAEARVVLSGWSYQIGCVTP